MLSTTGFSNPLGQFAVVRLSMSGAHAIPCLTWIDHDVAIAWSRDLNRSIQGTKGSFWVVPAEIQLDVDLIISVGLAIKF